MHAHDAVASGFKIGINKFSDMALDEFERMQGFKEIQDLGSDASKFLYEDEEEEESASLEEFTHKKNETVEKTEHGRGL